MRPSGSVRVDDVVAHRGLEAEDLHRVFELGDGFVGVVRGDHRRRRQPIAEAVADLGEVGVEAAAGPPPDGVVGMGEAGEPDARVQDGEVEPDLVHAVVEQRREERGRPVAGVGRDRPPRRDEHPRRPVGHDVEAREQVGAAGGEAGDRRGEAVGDVASRDPAHRLHDEGDRLDDVPVDVDDRVVDGRAGGHGVTSTTATGEDAMRRGGCEVGAGRFRGTGPWRSVVQWSAVASRPGGRVPA